MILLYHCPGLPWMPVKKREFATETEATAWGREHWPEAWVLASRGSDRAGLMDRFLSKRRSSKEER